jgi:DNA-binding NarL/FixJ family response regulator
MKIIIADDHHLVLEGLGNAINRNYPDAELSFAINKRELDGLLLNTSFDVLVLDVKFGPDNAKLFIKDIKAAYPALKILIVSSVSDLHSVQLIKQMGIDGYVLKSDSLVEVLSGLRAVLKGEKYFSSSLPEEGDERIELILTPREKQVLTQILDEKSTKEIAKILNVSEKTVEMHRANMFMKFEVKNVTGLVKKAIIMGLLED